MTPVFSALSPKTSPSSHAGPLLPVPGRPVARARIASDPCDACASHVLARQDESTVAPHRRRTRTILGDRDPVPQQEEAVSQSSAERDRRLPKTRPPYYVKSSATLSEHDWDDDTLDVDVRKSLDASGGDFVVPGAELHASSFAEPPRVNEDSVPRRNTLRFDADADADAALESFASSKRAISPDLANDSITSERSELSEEETFSPAEAARDAKREAARGTRGSRVVRVPVYSVAGRRLSVRELLHEKTRSMARSSDGARRLMRRVAGVDRDGRVGGETVAAILRSFNVASDADVVDAVTSELDRDVDGRVALAAFLEWALPDESCAATDVGPGTKSGARRPATARVRLEERVLAERRERPFADSTDFVGDGRNRRKKSESEKSAVFASSFSKPLSARDAERLLRRKMSEKFREGEKHTRRAFRSFDVDGDGFLDEREFFAVLDRFHVAVARDEREKMFAAFVGDSSKTPKRVSMDAFLEALGAPERYPKPEKAEKARAETSARFANGELRLEAAFARARRRARTDNKTRASRGMRARGVRVPEPAPEPALTLPEVRAALGREGDPALLRKLKTASDERADRLVTRAAARAVWRRHAAGVAGAAEKEAMRDFDDGFGRDLLELQHTRGSTVGGATSRGARREAPAVAVNPEHAFRDGFGPPGGPHATASIEAALREKLEARGVSGERAFRLLFDREGRGWVDRASLADALHRFNIPASEGEVDALVARYDGAGDGARIGAADFCERLLAPDFPTAAEKEKRRADGVVSAFRRAFKDEVSRHRGDGIDDDAATVSTRDALSAAARAAKAAKCRTLGASAARAAAATSLTDSGHVRVEAFVSACQRSIREAEALALKHAPFREPTGFEALGGEHYAPVSARTPPPFPAKPDVARFLRMARDKFAERVPLKGASETTKCARLFDPDRLGYVTPASFRRAMATLGLDAIDEETFAKTFARVAKETETVSRNAASAVCGTSAFVRAFLPARVAVDRPARNAVLAALEQSEAATEAEVRAVLEACDVDVEDPARVARLVRLSRRNGKNENENEKRKLDYAKLAGMVSQPEPRVRKATSPTPVVDHCTTDLLEIRDASPPSTPSFPPTPPFATD